MDTLVSLMTGRGTSSPVRDMESLSQRLFSGYREQAGIASLCDPGVYDSLDPGKQKMVRYVYHLYRKIFFHTGFQVPSYDGRQACDQKLLALIEGFMKEGRMPGWATEGLSGEDLRMRISSIDESSSTGVFVQDLEPMLLKAGIHDKIDPGILASVMAAYSPRASVWHTGEVALRFPTSAGRLARSDIRVRQISTEVMPQTRLPLYWRWFAAVWSDPLFQPVAGLTSGPGLVEALHERYGNGLLEGLLETLTMSARPISLASLVDRVPHRSVTNLLATLRISQMAEMTWRKPALGITAAHILSGSTTGRPYRPVDREYFETVVRRRLIEIYQALRDTYRLDIEMDFRGEEERFTPWTLLRHQGVQSLLTQEGQERNYVWGNLFFSLEATEDEVLSESDIAEDDLLEEPTEGETEGEGEGEDPPEGDPQTGTGEEPSDPEGSGQKNIIAEDPAPEPFLIDMSPSSGPRSYLYRLSVLKLMDRLKAARTSGTDRQNVAALETWCHRWLWIAHPATTHVLVKTLGLDAYLKPLFKEKDLKT